MLMLTAYMDETGHYKDPNKKYVGLGGLIAPADAWANFDDNWRQALTDFRIDGPFSMKDFAQSVGQYKRFKGDELRRKKILGRLMRIIENTGGRPFGSVVCLADYNANSEEWRSAVVDPYYLCVQHCAVGVNLFALNLEAAEKVQMVFAHHPEFSGRISNLYETLRRRNAQGELNEIGILAGYTKRMADRPLIRTPEESVPLQGADVVAYEIGQYFEKALHSRDKPPRWGFQEIIRMSFQAGSGPLLAYFGGKRLKDHQREIELFKEGKL
ncbi:MAG TPA: DUF3800 domain-containing protein, partial [Blastocatellia bacterium]|nr:DUF3800 domain-containing protein [Blastocatellia bacterium]